MNIKLWYIGICKIAYNIVINIIFNKYLLSKISKSIDNKFGDKVGPTERKKYRKKCL